MTKGTAFVAAALLLASPNVHLSNAFSSSSSLSSPASLSVVTNQMALRFDHSPSLTPSRAFSVNKIRGVDSPWHSFVPSSTAVFSSSGVIDVTATEDEDGASDEGEATGILGKIKRVFVGNQEKDGLTARQRLAKMGLSAVLSYGFVSNMSYAVTVSLAWYIHSKRTGLSPMVKGQWKGFLAVYAGFYIFNNFIRPLRLGLAVAITPKFDAIVQSVRKRLNCPRAAAIFVVVFMANVVGTTAAMTLGIGLASLATGVPALPGKV